MSSGDDLLSSADTRTVWRRRQTTRAPTIQRMRSGDGEVIVDMRSAGRLCEGCDVCCTHRVLGAVLPVCWALTSLAPRLCEGLWCQLGHSLLTSDWMLRSLGAFLSSQMGERIKVSFTPAFQTFPEKRYKHFLDWKRLTQYFYCFLIVITVTNVFILYLFLKRNLNSIIRDDPLHQLCFTIILKAGWVVSREQCCVEWVSGENLSLDFMWRTFFAASLVSVISVHLTEPSQTIFVARL